MPGTITAFATCIAVLWSAAAMAQTDCKSIADPAARLACFDRPAKTAPTRKAAPPALDKYRTEILRQKSSLWRDPYSIRDARISEKYNCESGPLFPPNSECICVTANAKNAYGGYTGVRRTLMIFSPSGQMTTSDGAILGYESYCRDMKPFPQLNGTP